MLCVVSGGSVSVWVRMSGAGRAGDHSQVSSHLPCPTLQGTGYYRVVVYSNTLRVPLPHIPVPRDLLEGLFSLNIELNCKKIF